MLSGEEFLSLMESDSDENESDNEKISGQESLFKISFDSTNLVDVPNSSEMCETDNELIEQWEEKLNKDYVYDDDGLVLSNAIHGPSVRARLLYKSAKHLEANNYLSSIFYQSEALCIGSRAKYNLLKTPKDVNVTESDTKTTQNLPKVNEKASDDDHLIIERLIDRLECLQNNPNQNYEYKIDSKIGVPKMIDVCKNFPKEWTVIQLCKAFNPEHIYMTKADRLMSRDPIFITLFCYTRFELINKPIIIKIESDSIHTSIYQDFHEMNENINIALKMDLSTMENGLELYQKRINNVEKKYSEIIENLKHILGPWITFFSGKPKTDFGISHEKKIFAKIDKFCGESFTARQRVLISLIARRFDLLDNKNVEKFIKIASKEIAKTSKQYTNLCDFFTKLHANLKTPADTLYFPCILIIDELLDFINWESINPSQELTRFCSFYILNFIYNFYKNDIVDGYLEVNVDHINYILNPGNDLPDMENRINQYIKKWGPNWNIFSGRTPSPEVLRNLLESGNVLLYSGHGNGLQIIDALAIPNMKIKSVVFLFGCESTKAHFLGFDSEAYGSYLIYQMALCPAVIGATAIISDLYTDMFSTFLISSWIPNSNENNWCVPESWYRKSNKRRKLPHSKPEASLLSCLANIRLLLRDSLPQRLLYNMVCRGLPAMSVSSLK